MTEATLTPHLLDSPTAQALLMGREWHVDLEGGLKALGGYLGRLAMQSGQGETTALERYKQMNAPALLSPQGAVQQVGASTVLSQRPVAPGSILRLQLSGPMLAEGDLCTWGMNEYADAIAMANDNPNIEGVMIHANTPGGEALAGQILHNAIKGSQKAVVVYADSLNSAGVYGTVAADEIVASGPISQIGSIGVYYSISKEFVNWYSQNMLDVYADQSGDKNKEWRALLEGDHGPMKRRASEFAAVFQQLVQEHRPLKGDTQDTLRGGTFMGRDAVRRGLADGMGDFNYAMKRLKANINKRKSMQ